MVAERVGLRSPPIAFRLMPRCCSVAPRSVTKLTTWRSRNSCSTSGTTATAPSRHYPKRSDWSVEISNNGPSIATGGGVDFVVTRPFAWRILELEYTHTWMSDVGATRPQNGLRIATSAVLRIGTW